MNFNKNFYNVELHNHLEAACDSNQIWNLFKEFNLPIGFNSEQELKDFLQFKKQTTLREFLTRFNFVLPVFRGNKKAIDCLCRNYVEKCAASRVCYAEVRFSPYSFVDDNLLETEVTKMVLDNLSKYGEENNVVIRSIISCVRREPLPSITPLQLALEFQNEGIVGIDVAGDEQYSQEQGGTSKDIKLMFKEAKEKGVHRTVHAGENGDAKMVKEAMDDMFAERIGHGYHVVKDEAIYREAKKRNIHFEVCPSSSFLTGSVDSDINKHPIFRFISDKVSFSINCDDMMITGRDLEQEFEFVRNDFHISDETIKLAQLNAAQSCFLPANEKELLIEHLNNSSTNNN